MSTELNSPAMRAATGSLVIVAIASIVPLLAGCTTVRQEFHGRDAGQVWTAMEAVAQSPEYPDWHVMENEVWVDPEEARIEIFRVVERFRQAAGTRGRQERREWRFQVQLEETDPPLATFMSRGMAVPAHASREGRQYFRDVRRLLRAELPLPREAAAATPRRDVEPPPQPAQELEAPRTEPERPRPEVDPDDLVEPK